MTDDLDAARAVLGKLEVLRNREVKFAEECRRICDFEGAREHEYTIIASRHRRGNE